ncbi:HigA family addiction module antitoxin [Kerstersia similis]|uniref:HigA family addiction module antitoxin n=1 Tax=Kerstersia similis TaxID=206505 RepID=UPI0039EEC172
MGRHVVAPPWLNERSKAVQIPCHPGEILREDVIAALGLSVTDAACRFGIEVSALQAVLDGRAAVDADLAQRLETAGFSTARTWLAMQANHDLRRKQQRA